MALNLPQSPSNGDTHLGSNGINYIYDAASGKWEVFVDPASGSNVWSRDPVQEALSPVYNGDDVELRDNSGITRITMTAEGTISATNIDIDSFPTLP